MRTLLLPIGLALAASASFAASRLPGPAFPNYASPQALDAACTRNVARAQAAIRHLERQPGGPGWLGAYDDLNSTLEDLSSPVYLLSNVHPDPAMRGAAEACELKWQGLFSTLGQNEKLYRAARRVQPRDAIDGELLKATLEGFEDAGAALPADKRARAKAINDRVTELGQMFSKAIRDEVTQLAFTEAELKGVPEGVWKGAKRDAAGRVLLGIDSPTYTPFMQTAVDASARERMWRAKTNEGGAGNLKLLAEIAQLRREYAQLFGQPSFADFTLRRRMAQDAASATRFLDEVRAAVTERERRELDELRAAKARALGQPDARLERWDSAFYAEIVKRERYSVDEGAFRAHFPPEESLAFVMRLAEKLFGVRYTRVPEAKLWHPDAQAYVATDLMTGRALATLYVDAYPREGKYGHAAVWPLRGGALRGVRAAQAALIVNLDRQGLSLDEMETLLHEFGHALHNNLATVRYAAANRVLDDYAEAPSQMLENWVYDPRVIEVLREVCPACKPVPPALLAQGERAERYGLGLQTARQQLFSSYDLALHGADAPEPMALWARMEGATLLGHVPGTMFPAGFSHIVQSNYAAGYYGYLWSKVVAADLRTPFARDKLDPAVGQRYRATVLAQGGQIPPRALVRQFLGREFTPKAFFEDLQR